MDQAPLISLPDLVAGGAWVAVALVAARHRGSLSTLAALTAAAWFLAEVVPEAVFWHRALIVWVLLAAPAWWPASWTARAVVVTHCAAAVFGLVWLQPAAAVALGALLLLGVAAEGPAGSGAVRPSAATIAALAFGVPAVVPLGRADAVTASWLYAAAIVVIALLTLVDSEVAARTRHPLDRVVEVGSAEPFAPSARDLALVRDLQESHERLLGEIENGVGLLHTARRRLAEAALGASDELRVQLETRALGPLRTLVASAPAGDHSAPATRHLVTATAEIDAIARGLGPRTLDAGAAQAFRELAEASPVPASAEIALDGIPPLAARTLYLAACEALANAVRHAGASALSVRAHEDDEGYELVVADDGHGGADPTAGTGLAGVRDRVLAVGGAFAVDSGPGGTVLRVRVPRGLSPSARAIEEARAVEGARR